MWFHSICRSKSDQRKPRGRSMSKSPCQRSRRCDRLCVHALLLFFHPHSSPIIIYKAAASWARIRPWRADHLGRQQPRLPHQGQGRRVSVIRSTEISNRHGLEHQQIILGALAVAGIIATTAQIGNDSILAWCCITQLTPTLRALLSAAVHMAATASF